MNFRFTRIRHFLRELGRRRVVHNVVGYVAVCLILIEAAGNILPPLGFPEESVRFVILACVGGLPVVAVLSWIYEFAEGKIVRTAPVGLPGPRGGDLAPRRDPRHLVILPFHDLSGNGFGYFSEGVTDDLTAILARIPELRVTSRTSARAYRDTQKTAAQIGEELRVGSILEGTVRRSGDRVRIVTQLIDIHGDRPIWGETYDREIDDVLAIQAELAQQIAQALEGQLSEASRDRLTALPTTDVEAYDAYLRGRFLWGERTEPGLEQSLDQLERAIGSDPGFAPAHAALSDSLITLGLYGVREPADVMPRARDAARRALDLDPGNGEALSALACERAIYEWDWEEAERGFREAIHASPSYATAHQWYAVHLLAPLGRFGEAREALERAGALDPISLPIQVSRAFVLLQERRYDEAIEACRNTLARNPSFALGHLFLGQALLHAGAPQEAVPVLDTALSVSGRSPDALASLARAQAAAGNDRAAQSVHRELTELGKRRYVSPGRLAEVSLARGRVEEAQGALEHAADSRSVDLIWMATTPSLDGLRGRERFERVRERMRLPDLFGAKAARERPAR